MEQEDLPWRIMLSCRTPGSACWFCFVEQEDLYFVEQKTFFMLSLFLAFVWLISSNKKKKKMHD